MQLFEICVKKHLFYSDSQLKNWNQSFFIFFLPENFIFTVFLFINIYGHKSMKMYVLNNNRYYYIFYWAIIYSLEFLLFLIINIFMGCTNVITIKLVQVRTLN